MKFSGFIFAAEDKNSHEDRYDFLFQTARYLDRHNYTALWTPERHFQEFGGSFPNPAVLSAALAAATERLHLRAGSVVVPHHHPVKIAEEWGLVDQLSKGRAGICFATGWHKRDFVFYPEKFRDRRTISFADIEVIQRLWAGETQRFDGVDEALPVKVYPPPYQRQIPLWLVFTSSPETWEKAAEMGFNVLALLNDWEMIGQCIKNYRRTREKFGHDPQAGIVTIGLHTFIGDDDGAVRRQVEGPMKSYLGSFLLAKNDDKRLQSGQPPMTGEEKEIILTAAFGDYYDNRSLLGTPEKCRKVVERLQGIGVDEVACLIDFGLDFDVVLEALDKLTALKDSFGVEPAPPESTADDSFRWYYERD